MRWASRNDLIDEITTTIPGMKYAEPKTDHEKVWNMAMDHAAKCIASLKDADEL